MIRVFPGVFGVISSPVSSTFARGKPLVIGVFRVFLVVGPLGSVAGDGDKATRLLPSVFRLVQCGRVAVRACIRAFLSNGLLPDRTRADQLQLIRIRTIRSSTLDK